MRVLHRYLKSEQVRLDMRKHDNFIVRPFLVSKISGYILLRNYNCKILENYGLK